MKRGLCKRVLILEDDIREREGKKRLVAGGGGSEWGPTLTITGTEWSEMFTALKVPKEWPLVLLGKIGFQQGKTFGSKQGKVMANGMLGVCSRRRKLAIWNEFLFWGQQCDESLIALGVLYFGEDFEVDFGKGCMTSIQCNVNFGYQLSICSRTEENHRKISSICPAAEPSRCRPTDFWPEVRRSNTRTLMVMPSCAVALFTKNVQTFLARRFLFLLDE